MPAHFNATKILYMVTSPGIADQHRTEADAINCANEVRRNATFGPEVIVVCIERSDAYETHQRVWPSVGPVYASHRQSGYSRLADA